MNIWNFAIKEMKGDFRDTKTLIFLLAFPILLMLILGTALTNAFSSQITIEDIHVIYKSTVTQNEITKEWDGFVHEADKSKIFFEKIDEGANGKQQIQKSKYNGYLELTDTGLHYYGSSNGSLKNNIVQGMLTAFTDKYNLVNEVVKVNPGLLTTVLNTNVKDSYIVDKALNSDEQPGAMDYFAITMTTMIALYGSMTSSHLINGERRRKTAARLMAAPVSKSEIFIGKISGSILLNSLCVAIVVLFSKFVFKANWGDHYGSLALVLLTEVVMAISLGMCFSAILNGETARAILMTFIQLASFFGGAYFPFDNEPGLMNSITYLSPLRWSNSAITQIIYANDWTAAIPAILLNLGLAALCILVAGLVMQRKEGL